MKKKTKKVYKRIFIFAAVVCVLIYCASHLTDFAYNHAVNLAKQKQYEKSLPYFELAILLDNNNLDAYYQYSAALSAMPMTYNVQKKLYGLAHYGKSGAAATKANGKLARYKYFILNHTRGNYIQQVPYQDLVLHWNPSTFPLKVYIENYDQSPYYSEQVEKAFYAWEKATQNYINFEFVKL